MSSYRIEECCNTVDWEKFIYKSPQATIFHSSKYLDLINVQYQMFFVKKGEILHGGFVLLVSQDKHQVLFNELVIYNGPLLIENNMDQNVAKRTSFEFEVTEVIVQFIATQFQHIKFQTSWKLKDMRPFLWYEYGKDCPKYELDLRYTSVLEIPDGEIVPENNNPFFMNIGTSRRQEIRLAIKEGISVNVDNDFKSFIDLYRQTMDKNQGSYTFDYINQMKTVLCQTVSNKSGYLFSVKNSSGQMISGAFFLVFKEEAYYMWGASNVQIIDRYSGTMVIWESIRKLQKLGIKKIDLEGINSPKRGWFKLSFGGSIEPYYIVKIDGE